MNILSFRNKPRKKRSKIWFISREELVELATKSNSIAEILKHFGLQNKGTNYRTLQQRLKSEEIDYSHIKLGLSSNGGRKFPHASKVDLRLICVEHSTYARYHLKRRLIAEGILGETCAICHCEPVWRGQLLVLQLDHINGISNDHRIENLRLLCPNCHSQTATFAGKRK